MGMFTEKDGDFEYPPGHQFVRKTVLKRPRLTEADFASGGTIGPGHPAFPNKLLDDIPYKPVAPSAWHLEGYNKFTGAWISLMRYTEEKDVDKAIKDCLSRTQPAPSKVVVVWDDFSVFRAEPLYTYTYRI